jgi:PBSX family phage terminase large subunit
MAGINDLYTKKQRDVLRFYYRNPDFFILVNHGAVRSGKTFIDNDIFLAELRRIGVHAKKYGILEPQYILAAASIGSVRRNIINPIIQKYGIKIKLDNFNQFRLFGVLVCCFGHDNIGNLSTVTGMTAYGAYVNEGTKANDEVLKQIIKRCSGDMNFKTHIIIDTNPDSPIHPLKVDYIDKADGKTIQAFWWRLDDNEYISESYKANIKASTPSGVFTSRDIEGRWVTPEGAVYLDFDESKHLIDYLPRRKDGKLNFTRYFCGVDWGYEHKGSICLFGVVGEGSGELDGKTILIKEITARHKLIGWWTEQAKNLIKEYGYGIPFYCDDARPDNISEFRTANIWAVEANKSISPGIEEVAKQLKMVEFLIYAGGTSEFLNEIYQYAWNPKTGLPEKLNDDVMDAVRYAVYTDKEKHKYAV